MLLKAKSISAWQLFRKVLSILSPVFKVLFILFACWTAYKMMMWIFLWFLKIKLKGKTLEEFKKVLGNNYVVKKLGEGDKRYKWEKRLFSVKANFDNEGNMICNMMDPMKFWSLRSELSFI